MAPISVAQLKTSAQACPMICSGGAPIMSAKAPLAHTMRESSDCTQMPSSIASNSVFQERGDESPPVCEAGNSGSDDSSFVVIFYRAYQPPSLRVSSIRFLPSNSLASDASLECYFARPVEINAITHEIGIFPQSLGNIPHQKSLSAGLEPLPAAMRRLEKDFYRSLIGSGAFAHNCAYLMCRPRGGRARHIKTQGFSKFRSIDRGLGRRQG